MTQWSTRKPAPADPIGARREGCLRDRLLHRRRPRRHRPHHRPAADGSSAPARSSSCAGALVPRRLLDEAGADIVDAAQVELVDTADLTLDQIVDVIARADAADPVTSRGSSPATCRSTARARSRCAGSTRTRDRLRARAGRPASRRRPPRLKRELTVPTVGQSVVLTRISRRATPMPANETLEAARCERAYGSSTSRPKRSTTSSLPHPALRPGLPGRGRRLREPAAGGDPARHARRHRRAGPRAGLVRSAVILVGRVLAAQAFPDDHLYSAARDRHDCTSSQVLP